MRNFILTLIIVLPLFTYRASADFGTVCENCTALQHRDCARNVGQGFPLQSPANVWVFDFPNWTIRKFQVWKEDTTQVGGTMQKIEKPNTEKSSGGEIPSATLVTAIELTPSQWEQDLIDRSLLHVNDFLRQVGSGQIISGLCSLSGPSSLESQSQKRNEFPSPNQVFSESLDFTVPPTVAGSAYDVIGNQSLSNLIGQEINNRFPNAVNRDALINIVAFTQGWNIQKISIFIATFADGSIGIIRYNSELKRWEVDMTSLEDSEGNPIPLTRDNAIGSTYNFIGGVENMNVGLMRNRLENGLGFIISGTPSGGAACISTTFSCNDQGCTVTCRTK